MMNYGYRSIRTRVEGIAGVIERGNLARGQRKGDRFVLTMPTDIIINRVNGKESTITVLTADGRADARIHASTAIY